MEFLPCGVYGRLLHFYGASVTGQRYGRLHVSPSGGGACRLTSDLYPFDARGVGWISVRGTRDACVCYVTVMVFITGVCLLLQTTTTRSTANVGLGEMQTPQADGDKKKRKPKIVRNLKVISPVRRSVGAFLARLRQEIRSHGGLK